MLEWMFRHAAGIDSIDTAPGFRQARFVPVLNWRVRSMEASYDSASGVYACSWEMADREHVKLSVTVPFNCSAVMRLPLAPQAVYEDTENLMFADVRNGECYLQAGTYTVSYCLSKPLKKTYDLDTPMWKLKAEPEVVERLAGLLDLREIAEEYMGQSVLGYADRYKGMISDERMEQIRIALTECE